MNPDKQNEILESAVRLLADRCPRLTKMCYWAGTSAIALDELHHRQSFDLDFHTAAALADVRPILTEIEHAFPGGFEVVEVPDEFGNGFRGILTLPDGERITIEVLSNYEDVPDEQLVESGVAPKLRRVSWARYLADKIQCIAERNEARDLFDVLAVLRNRPEAENTVKKLLAAQDALLIAERLCGWSDDDIEKDLQAYEDVRAADSKEARDLLLKWLGELENSVQENAE
jgi:hypothetical protein